MRTRLEAGFTLVEVVIVAGIIALVAGTAGTFFLAGATPAVAAAHRDVIAAFDEARRTAVAFDTATVVFAPSASGAGYSARVYARVPGDPEFRARNGPSYDSNVAVSETAAPLGAPGFAFTIDRHGTVTGLANYSVAGSDYTSYACPSSGTFTLALAYVRETATVTIPCRTDVSAATPAAWQTAPAATTPLPVPSGTCPSTANCAVAIVAPPPAATCPAGYVPDTSSAGLCDAVVPTPAPTCPAGTQGVFPACTLIAIPTPAPPAQTAAPNVVTLFSGAASTGSYGHYYDAGDGNLGQAVSYAYHTYATVQVTTAVAPVDAEHALLVTIGGGTASAQTTNLANCLATMPPGTVPFSTNPEDLYIGTGAPPFGTYLAPLGAYTYPNATAPFASSQSVVYFDPAATAGTYTVALSAPFCTSAPGPNANYEWDFAYPVTITQTQ